MNTSLPLLALITSLTLASTPLYCRAAPSTEAYAELAQLKTLSEVMRHLYRWYLDEADFNAVAAEETIQFHVVPTSPELDRGDKSLYAQIRIPMLSTVVLMKKTNYPIEELGITVKSDTFKIVNVAKALVTAPATTQTALSLAYPTRDMLDYLFASRSQPDFPSEALSKRLGKAISRQIQKHKDKSSGEQTIFISPLSPVGNEIWAYWVEAGLLVRWSSDIELDNPAVWEHDSLATKVFDIEEQTVLSFSQTPASNAYLTRDQVGRALYNCTVLGQMRRITFTPTD